MTFLIVSSNLTTQRELSAAIHSHFGEGVLTVCSSNYKQADEMLKEHSPRIVISDLLTPKFNLFKLVVKYPPHQLRNYYIIPRFSWLAIRAIRLGIAGIYDFPQEEALLLNAMERDLIKQLDTEYILTAKQNIPLN